MSEPDKPEQPQSTPPPQSPPPPPPPQQGPPQYSPYPGSYPPPPPAPYAGYAPPPSSSPKNGLGIAALVVAIVGLLFCWTVAGGIILGLCAVIIGFVARSRVKRGEATNGGVAIAGIVLGFLAIIAALVFIPIWIGFFDEAGVSDYTDCVMQAGSDQEALQRCADQFQERIEDEFNITVTPTG